MAYQTMWFDTEIPEDLVDIIEREISHYEDKSNAASISSGIDKEIRDSRTAWISDNHWVPGLCMTYILKANKDNFQYDITGIDGGEMQYTIYEEGMFYDWHQDAGVEALENDAVRKLSIILQLSNPEDYEGGEVELINESGNPYFVPKKRGTLIVFDSRTKHRVKEVFNGKRKSLVGWVVGPRWK